MGRVLTKASSTIVTTLALLAASAGLAVATPQTWTYPLPGAAGTGHGGSTCVALSGSEAAMGKTAAQNGTASDGQTWSYGGGGAAPGTGTDCPVGSESSLVPFDTSRFQRLFWGASQAPQLALDGAFDSPGETLQLDPTNTALANGSVGWSGSTTMTWCVPSNCPTYSVTPVSTRVQMTVTDLTGAAVSLVDPATAGITDAWVGGVTEVTPALTKYRVQIVMLAQDPMSSGWVPAVTMYNSYNHPISSVPQTQMSFTGAFWYVDRPPSGSIATGSPVGGKPANFTATATDPDGQIVSFAWDTNHDGVFDNGTFAVTPPTATATSTVSVTYPAGAHTISVRVTDDEGTTTVLTKSFTVADATPPVVSLSLPGQRLGAVLKKGLAVKLRTNEAGSAVLTASIPSKLARKLRLKNPVSTRKLTISAPSTISTRLVMTRKVRLKLSKLRSVKFTVKAVVKDRAGNQTVVSKTITVRK